MNVCMYVCFKHMEAYGSKWNSNMLVHSKPLVTVDLVLLLRMSIKSPNL